MALNTTRSHPLGLEDLEDVPGNGLALAVRVGGEDQLVGGLHGLGDLRKALLRLRVHLPDHVEVPVRVDRTVLGGQVAHVSVRGEDLVAGAKVFVDGLGLGRRLDNDNVYRRDRRAPESAKSAGPTRAWAAN
jgi:hypothetical protein